MTEASRRVLLNAIKVRLRDSLMHLPLPSITYECLQNEHKDCTGRSVQYASEHSIIVRLKKKSLRIGERCIRVSQSALLPEPYADIIASANGSVGACAFKDSENAIDLFAVLTTRGNVFNANAAVSRQ